MCLAIPMKIVKTYGDVALVKAGGLERRANMSLLNSAKVGDYVLVHAGFAIEKVKVSEAKKTLRALREVQATR
jgi:hydrogenase expression/formation protein HypC